GGIQLILSGDFCQLPPVPLDGKAVKFAFDAESWYPCMGPPVILTKVFCNGAWTYTDLWAPVGAWTSRGHVARLYITS
ncbi:uncharacterized protein SCHCODRAFT_02489786, partial [Schizophyllum commune H4-8]|uniref:uncharacterized protein n=1 Tax=Schizophyllum commune (strain H4-8 / FGSC 9210) TaxID=578458 RepID=UPI002160067A